jgi:hypothetical protein
METVCAVFVLAQTEYCILLTQKTASRLAHIFTSENVYARYMKQQYVFPHVHMLGKRIETLVLGYKFRCISFYGIFSTQPWCFTCYSPLRETFKIYLI